MKALDAALRDDLRFISDQVCAARVTTSCDGLSMQLTVAAAVLTDTILIDQLQVGAELRVGCADICALVHRWATCSRALRSWIHRS